LHRLIVEFHLVSYARIEFGANVLLFVPLGILLALILRQRYLIVPISIVTTVGIECAQGIFLPHRVASMGDVVANLAGACVGLLIVVGFERWKSSPARGSKTYGRPMP
jgi:glycopeptide antibiotics resistance protein